MTDTSITPRHILISNIRLIGDVILLTPLIALLKQAYPDATIDFLVSRGTGEFLERDPDVRAVHYIEPSHGRSLFKRNRYLLTLFRQYDLAITMNPSDRGSIAVLTASRRWRVGFIHGSSPIKDAWKRLTYSHTINYRSQQHYIRLCQQIAEALGIRVEKLEVRVRWDSRDEDKVREELGREGVTKPFVVIHPFARWQYKFWSFEKFAQTSDLLVEHYGLTPVWTSSPSPQEIQELERAAGYCSHPPILLPGRFNLNQMACLLHESALFIGLDTAITHLAASTNTPLVTLFGPTLVHCWSPWDNNGPIKEQCPLKNGTQRSGNAIVIQSERDCVPCAQEGCNNDHKPPPCLAEITPEQVLAAVAELLGPGPIRREV